MINLLPPERKQTIRAGLINRLLVRYVFLSVGVMAAVMIIFALTWLSMVAVKSNAEQTIATAEASSRSIQQDASDVTVFENNLRTAKEILSREINYSEIILRYASAIPPNTIIDSITLDPSITGQSSTFTAKVKTEGDVTKLKDALSESEYFDEVRLSEVVFNQLEETYKYSVTIDLVVNPSLLATSEDTP